jgi:hypothetical protein
MKVCEVIKPRPIVSSQVQQQQRVNRAVQQIAANDQAPTPPTEDEIALALHQYQAMKKQSDEQYVRRTRQQAMQSIEDERHANAPKRGGRELR